jgi:Ca2+-dependent lipid-binding protein
MTLEQKLQQQQQQAVQPSAVRRRKQQQPYYPSVAGPERRFVSPTEQQDTGTRSGSGSSSRQGRVGRWWSRTKTAVVEAVEDAAAWLLHMLYLLSMWLLKVLLIPLRALFGPWYRFNRRLKTRQRELLSQQQLDLSALHDALGALPSWLAGIGGATEKVTWLNELLAQIWPVLDPVVCQLIRSTVEPMLDDMKPPFIAAMGFQKLTLGELPLELEGIRVVGGDYQGKSVNSGAPVGGERAAIAAATADDDDRIEMEVDFRWVGEPNISFFVELAMAGPYTRMVPKVSHLTARGTMRLGLTRLVPQLPGFGALMVSMARTPQVKFSLDFGPALGGKFTAKPVAAFLDPFIRDTLANLLVWPNRFVIPILPRNVTGNLDDLTLHSVGVLEVEVISARQLPKKGGAFSTVDPQVEMWTQPQHRVYTSVKKSSRNPNWRNQKHELLVQEPDSQLLRVILNDIDMLNVKELLRVNLLKGAANLLRSARPIGRAALPLRSICEQPFKRQELELRLSSSEWAYELGVVDEDDDSTLKLAVLYKPFKDLDAASTKPISAKGVLFVDVRQCEDLPSGDYHGGSSDPYVLLKVAGQKQQTVVFPHTTSPVYNAHFEFFNVQAQDVLQVQVWDKDTFKPDDLLGQVELPVTAIVDWSQGGKRGWRDGWWKLKGGRRGHKEGDYGRIEMKVQFRPY